MRKVLNIPEVRERQKLSAKNAQLKRWSDKKNIEKMSKMKTFLIDEKALNMFCNIMLENNRPTRANFLELLSNNNIIMDYLINLNENQSIRKFNHFTRSILNKMVKMLNFKNYTEFRKNYALNHKVAKVEYLTEKDDAGCITVDNNHNFAVSKNGKPLVFILNSLLENYYMPQSADGRGSQIDSVGGQSAGFTELDDLYYFSRKMYRALKYPLSRVSAGEEKREADIMFGGNNTGEIQRDEVKWARFLERQQGRFCKDLVDMFLIHLDLKKLKTQYNLTNKNIRISMNPPSSYREQIEQNNIEARFNNYQSIADREEFSKYFLMKKYMRFSDEDIMENVEGRKKDKEFGFDTKED